MSSAHWSSIIGYLPYMAAPPSVCSNYWRMFSLHTWICTLRGNWPRLLGDLWPPASLSSTDEAAVRASRLQTDRQISDGMQSWELTFRYTIIIELRANSAVDVMTWALICSQSAVNPSGNLKPQIVSYISISLKHRSTTWGITVKSCELWLMWQAWTSKKQRWVLSPVNP